jgi:hypothetical protein
MSDQEARRGRKRKPWAHVATEAFLETETLRKGAQRWLREKKIKHSTLTATTFEGVRGRLVHLCTGVRFLRFGTRSGSPHFGNLSIYLSKTLYRELGMVRSRQEFFNVSYQSI